MHVAFRIPYVYNYIAKLCRKFAKAIQNQLNTNVRAIGQGEAMRRKFRMLKLGGGETHDRSANCRLRAGK
jgi:hypothetical protein